MTSAASEQIYCFKCREKTDTLEAQEVVLKNGRPAVTGKCDVCGTKKFRMSATRNNQWVREAFLALLQPVTGCPGLAYQGRILRRAQPPRTSRSTWRSRFLSPDSLTETRA